MHTEETKKKLSLAKLGSKNPSWKGTEVSYNGLHRWFARNYRHLKTKCSNCSSKDKLEFALKKGCTHSRDINRYFVLCDSCHKKYDYTDERRAKLSKSLKGRKITWGAKISKAQMGRKMSDETKEKMSLASKINYLKRKRDISGRFIS